MDGAELDRILNERAEISVEIAKLQMRDEQLIREHERLLLNNQDQPVLVRIPFLLKALDCSWDTLDRLRKNEAKGFPKPITSVDSDPRWYWPDVQTWIEERKRDAAGSRTTARARR